MSIEALVWANQQHVGHGPACKAVLVALANMSAPKDGSYYCWPSVSLIAKYTEQSERSVRNALRWLEPRFISRESRFVEGRQTSNGYRVHVVEPTVQTPLNDVQGGVNDVQPPLNEVQGPLNDVQGGEGERGSPPGVNDVQAELNEEPLKASMPRKRGTRIPDNFKPSKADIAWQRVQGISDEMARRETEKFINHYQSVTGQNAVRLSWSKTWRNWMLNAQERAPSANGSSARLIVNAADYV
jgi:hypothetical protein